MYSIFNLRKKFSSTTTPFSKETHINGRILNKSLKLTMDSSKKNNSFHQKFITDATIILGSCYFVRGWKIYKITNVFDKMNFMNKFVNKIKVLNGNDKLIVKNPFVSMITNHDVTAKTLIRSKEKIIPKNSKIIIMNHTLLSYLTVVVCFIAIWLIIKYVINLISAIMYFCGLMLAFAFDGWWI